MLGLTDALGDGHLTHLLTDTDLVVEVVAAPRRDVGVLFRILFVDLLLQLVPHQPLLCVALLGHDSLLVATTGQDIAFTLQVKIDSIFKHSASRFDVRKVLLSDGRVKFAVGGLRVVRSVDVERAILWVERGLRLHRSLGDTCSNQVFMVHLGAMNAERLRRLMLLAQLIALENLPL